MVVDAVLTKFGVLPRDFGIVNADWVRDVASESDNGRLEFKAIALILPLDDK